MHHGCQVTSRHLQDRRAKIRQATGNWDGIFHSSLDLYFYKMERENGFDKMALKDGIFWRQDGIIATYNLANLTADGFRKGLRQEAPTSLAAVPPHGVVLP